MTLSLPKSNISAAGCGLLCWCVATSVDAQVPALVATQAPVHTFGGGLGATHVQVQDRLTRGFRYSGPGMQLQLAFERERASNWQQVQWQLPLAALRNRYGHRSFYLQHQLDYAFARKIERGYSCAGRLSWFVGARARWAASAQYNVDFDEEHLYWATAFELAPMVMVRAQPTRRSQLGAQLDTPLLSVISRPAEYRYYKIDKLTHPGAVIRQIHSHPQLASVNRHGAVRVQVKHRYALRARTRLTTAYSLGFSWYTTPRRLLILAQTFEVSLEHVF